MKVGIILKRFFYYVLGFLILTLGQRLFVEAGLGAASLDAVCVGLAGLLGMSAGFWVAVTALVMILISALLSKKRPRFEALFSSYVFGVLFDMWGAILSRYSTEWNVEMKLLMYLTGICLAPLGTAVYFRSGFAKSALDVFILSIREWKNIKIGAAKTYTEISFCITALIIGGPIGLTTVTTAFLFGPVLQFYLHILRIKPASN